MKDCGCGMEVCTIKTCFRAWAHNSDINIVDGVFTVVQRCTGQIQTDSIRLDELVYITVSRVKTWTEEDRLLAQSEVDPWALEANRLKGEGECA